MLLLKLTALTCVISLALAILLEVYFGFSTRPYLFGFPRFKWPLVVAVAVIWAIAFKTAYYLLFQRWTFYGS